MLYCSSMLYNSVLVFRKKPKKDKDIELTMAVANAKLWSSRLDVSEKSRNEYR